MARLAACPLGLVSADHGPQLWWKGQFEGDVVIGTNRDFPPCMSKFSVRGTLICPHCENRTHHLRREGACLDECAIEAPYISRLYLNARTCTVFQRTKDAAPPPPPPPLPSRNNSQGVRHCQGVYGSSWIMHRRESIPSTFRRQNFLPIISPPRGSFIWSTACFPGVCLLCQSMNICYIFFIFPARWKHCACARIPT